MKSKSISQLALEIIAQGDNDDCEAVLRGIAKLLADTYESSMDAAHLNASCIASSAADAITERAGN